MSYLHTQKYHSEIGCHNIRKNGLNHGFNTQIPFIYAYSQNTPTILGTFAILVVWWGGEQYNRHKMAQNAHIAKIFEMIQGPYQVC
jgi:hypothetical protein